MNLAIATDYKGSTGDPEDSLRHIAASGFTHLHWCHQWNTCHLYSDWEIAKISRLLKSLGLRLLDIHGSDGGMGGGWAWTDETYRRAGVELVLNRIRMLRLLDGEGALMMHIPVIGETATPEARERALKAADALRRSLDELLPVCEAFRVPLALENMPGDTFEILSALFREYPADLVGLCYDSGHGNIAPAGLPARGLEHLEEHLDRLMALHLHDNDGSGDQHRPPYYGTVDWARLVKDIRASAYPRMLSFEIAMREPLPTEPDAFLRDAHERCLRVASL